MKWVDQTSSPDRVLAFLYYRHQAHVRVVAQVSVEVNLCSVVSEAYRAGSSIGGWLQFDLDQLGQACLPLSAYLLAKASSAPGSRGFLPGLTCPPPPSWPPSSLLSPPSSCSSQSSPSSPQCFSSHPNGWVALHNLNRLTVYRTPWTKPPRCLNHNPPFARLQAFWPSAAVGSSCLVHTWRWSAGRRLDEVAVDSLVLHQRSP